MKNEAAKYLSERETPNFRMQQGREAGFSCLGKCSTRPADADRYAAAARLRSID